MMESDDYVPQFSQMGEDPSSMGFTDFSPDTYIAPAGGGPMAPMMPGQQSHHDQQHAIQQQMYYQQHNLAQHQQMSGHYMPHPPHPEPPCASNPTMPASATGGREGAVGSIFDPVFMGTPTGTPTKSTGKGSGGKKKGGAGGTKLTKKQQQQQQQQLQQQQQQQQQFQAHQQQQFHQHQQSQPTYGAMPPQQYSGQTVPSARMQMMSPQHQGYGPPGYSTYPQQQQQNYGSGAMPPPQQQQQPSGGYGGYGTSQTVHQQQQPYPVPYRPPIPPGHAGYPAGAQIRHNVAAAAGGYPSARPMAPVAQSSQDIMSQQHPYQAYTEQQQQGGNRPAYGHQQSSSTYSPMTAYQQQQSYPVGPPVASAGPYTGASGAGGVRMPSQQQQQPQYPVQAQQHHAGGYPSHSAYPQHPPSSTGYMGGGNAAGGYPTDTPSANVDATSYGQQQQQSAYYRQGANSQMVRPATATTSIRPPGWPMAPDISGPRMVPPSAVPNPSASGYSSQMYGQPQQPPMYGRMGQTATQSMAGQPPPSSTVSSINHLQSVLEYSLPDGKLGQSSSRPPYSTSSQNTPSSMSATQQSQPHTGHKPSSSPPPPTPRPKTPLTMSTASSLLSPSPAIQQISPAGGGPGSGGHVAPSSSTSAGPTTSLSVVMPSDHRGPAVQLNIQPNSQPTTLITLYQLPPGSQPLPHSSMMQQQQQQTLPIPPEPIPSKNFGLSSSMTSPATFTSGTHYLEPSPSMAPVTQPSFIQDVSSTTLPPSGKGGKGKGKGKGKGPAAAPGSIPGVADSPPKKTSVTKRKRTAPTPAILPEDDGVGYTAAAVAAIAEVAAQPLSPKQRKKEIKKSSTNRQQPQDDKSHSQESGVSSELERMLSSGPLQTGASVPLGFDPTLPATPTVDTPLHSSASLESLDIKEKSSNEETNAINFGCLDSTEISHRNSNVSEHQMELSTASASDSSVVNVSEQGFQDSPAPVKSEPSALVEMDISSTSMDGKAVTDGNDDHSDNTIQPVAPIAVQENRTDFETPVEVENETKEIEQTDLTENGRNEEMKTEVKLESENGTNDSFLAMSATTAIEASSNTPKRKGRKKATQDDNADATSSPSTNKNRSKNEKEPKEPKPKKTPITSKYAGGKRTPKKKRRSATVFYSDESEEEERSAVDIRKSVKGGKFIKKASSGGKKPKKGDVAAQLIQLERRATSSSDLTGNGTDGQASRDALGATAVVNTASAGDLNAGTAPAGEIGMDEVNLAAFAETRRSTRVTKRKQYVDDWDYGISGSDEDRKSTSPGAPGTSTSTGTLIAAGHDGKATRTPLADPKDPAAAYFFVDNPPAEDSHIVEKILGCRVRKTAMEKKTQNEDAGNSEEQQQDVDEFYVKYKNFSYLHCEWQTVEELEVGDKRVHQKVKRFRQKHRQALFLDEFDEDEPFNPDYITVDRVLDVSTALAPVEETSSPAKVDTEMEKVTDPDVKEESSGDSEAKTGEEKDDVKESGDQEGQEDEDETKQSIETDTVKNAELAVETATPRYRTVTHYLVKWRSLPYEEAMWELESDVDPVKITEFYSRRKPPTETKDKPRPRADDWKKVAEGTVYKNGNQLRDYQMEGISWLLFCWHNRQNCILADEMGLGKTIQTITFLVEVQKGGIRGPFLIIAPLSTITNWQREFETWSDMNAIVYHGTAASRRMIQEYEMYYKNDAGDRVTNLYKFNALITTYEMILTDCELLKDIPWRVCVIDEAHRLKNRNCKLLTGLATYRMEHRVLLTGTPLQNNIEELFSLLNFLEPRQFSNSQLFLAEFGQLQTDDQVQKLQEILKPMMLRRLKEDVEKSLKPKEETIIEVELTNIQKKYYRAILERNFSYLCKSANVPSLMNTMMELRKCCNHPFLITGAEESILAEYRAQHRDAVDEEDIYLNASIQSSGKLVLIDKLLPRLRANGHKVLVFSQMVRCLDILEDYLAHRKYPYERIDGNVRGDLRQAAIDRFCRPECDRFVFLLCTRAGGLGINLTAADTVIIFDSDWNPQNDLQAQARCHRIGQEKFVKVYRLITRQSYEREMFDKASVKLGLDKAVLQSMGPNKENANAQLSKKEIEELLRKGAYGAIMDETNEGDRFCEEDIDQILQRRTQTITIQPGVKGSTFAKASFAVSNNRSDIDINDPNFWQKWARKANVDPDLNPEKDLILYEPRQRKRRFADQYDEHGKGDAGSSDEDSENNEKGEGSDSDSASDSRKIRAKNRNRKRARAMAAERGDDDADDSDYPDELAFTKSDYFRVEKYLSIFGWGRWKEILKQCSFKQTVSENDVKVMCRTVLLHCLRQYHGDEKIKEFIWQLITPPEEGGKTKDDMKNHQGLYGPVPRGRRTATTGRQGSKGELMDIYHQGWAALPTYNPPVLAVDYGYERHLQRHANKVLLRVRLLYYLEHEVIGPLTEKVLDGADWKELDLQVPWHPEIPVPWWDGDADKSLLIGIYKHGFENFDAMRMDPALVFLQRCGPLKLNSAEATGTERKDGAVEEEKEAANGEAQMDVSKQIGDEAEIGEKKICKSEEKEDKDEQIEMDEGKKGEWSDANADKDSMEETEYLQFPSAAELNGRFRRLITLCQRSSKISYVKEEQKAKRMARQEQMQAALQERELRKLEERQRWSRREESDFYRTLISFGVEQDPNTGGYIWERFKQLARLEAKYDHTLTDYYLAYMAMCKRVCKRPLSDEEQRISLIPETLSDERANKVLQRLELLARVRHALALAIVQNEEQVLEEKLKLCKKSPDFPNWWEPGRHDFELLRGIAKHGLNRSEDYVLQDPDLIFHSIWKSQQKESLYHSPTRAVTRTLAKITGNQKDDDQEESKEEIVEKESETNSGFGDAEAAISQILAQQTGSVLQWPKERAIIFRLQNVCHLIEKGEWPTPRAYSLLDVASADQGSSTPDTPGADTPGPSDTDGHGNLGQAGSSMSRKEQQTLAGLNSPFGLPMTAGGALKLDTFGDLAAAAAAAAFPLTGTAGLGGLGRQQSGGTGRGQTQRGSGRGRKRRQPLQDIMETERERMRALMHQSFLQQLEQFAFAGGFPLQLPHTASPPPANTSSSSSHSKARSPASSMPEDQQVLNLSTKAKKTDKEPGASSSHDRRDHASDTLKPLPFNDLAAMASLPPDTRVPVINIRDGSRLTGKDAPSLRNLAAWLSENPNFIIDMPAPTSALMGALAGTSSPIVASTSTGQMDSELEPGEIVRSGTRNRPPSRVDSPSQQDPSQQHVTVWNRKNGLKLSGSKAPTMSNLAMWLEKNPDWDIDPSCVDIAKKIKLSDKSKQSVHETQSSSKRSSSSHQRGAGSSSTAVSASSASSTASSAAALAALAGQPGMGGNADPLTALLAATVAGLDPLQLSMLFPYGAASPAMLGLPSATVNVSTSNPFGAINPLSLFGGVPTSPPPALQAQQTSSTSKKDSRSSSKTSSAAETAKSKSHAQQQQQLQQQLQQQQQQQQQEEALAAAMNPFLLPGMAAGIFGMNPFLAGGGGVMPSLGFAPPNIAAMAQLQALMGLQGMENLIGASGAEAILTSSANQTSTTIQSHTSASSSSASVSKSHGSSTSGGGKTTSGGGRTGGAGGQGKLNALVSKLTAETKKRQQQTACAQDESQSNVNTEQSGADGDNDSEPGEKE